MKMQEFLTTMRALIARDSIDYVIARSRLLS